jgi:hypothetical protein
MHSLADGLAKDAFENHFSSRRGIWQLEDYKGVLCLYNNNPYDKYPDLRDEELAEFRARMKERGLKELAFAAYPPDGEEDAGYTYARLISTGEDAEETSRWAYHTMMEILKKSYKRME